MLHMFITMYFVSLSEIQNVLTIVDQVAMEDVETADEEELLRRVKAELEQPVEAEISHTSLDYYNKKKGKVIFNVTHTKKLLEMGIFIMISSRSLHNLNHSLITLRI